MRATVVILGTVLISALPATAAAPRLVLVQAGEPMSVIIVPADASHVVWQAATELRDTIRKISGADLTILAEDEFPFHRDEMIEELLPDLSIIFIGPCQETRTAGIDVSELGPEGFRIKVDGNRLFIIGRDDSAELEVEDRSSMRVTAIDVRQRGTLYGVYSLLEQDLGVRWLFPGELGEVVPDQSDVSIPQLDRTDAPRLQLRMSYPSPAVRTNYIEAAKYLGLSDRQRYQRILEEDQWAARCRAGLSFHNHITHGHLYLWYRHGKDHPEYFAMQPDGNRYAWDGRSDGVRLCLSNDEVAAALAQLAIEWFQRSPDLMAVGLSPDDGSDATECVCDRCAAMGPTISDRYAIFYSKVAEIVSRSCPDRFLANFAYSEYSDAPLQVKKLHPNLLISLVGWSYWATDWAGGTDDDIRERSISHSLAWAKIASKVIWRPNLFHRAQFGIPSLYSYKLAEDYRSVYATGKLVGVDHDRFQGHWGAEGLDYYLAMKLAWDPDADVDELIDDYCQKGFGAAATTIRAYFDAVEAHTDQIAARRYSRRAGEAKDDSLIRINGMPLFLAELYPPEVLSAWQTLLSQAKQQAAADQKVLARIAMLQDALDLVPHTIAVHDLDCALIMNLATPTKRQQAEILADMHTFAVQHADSYGVYLPYVTDMVGLQRLTQNLEK